MSEPIFEVVGLPYEEDNPALLCVWSAAASSPVSFAAEESGPEKTIWRMNIPDDEALAEQWLTKGEQQLDQAQKKLANITPRLNRLAEMAPVIGATSFDTMTAALPSAEQALLMEMSAPPSFGLTEDIGVMLEKVHQAVIHYAAAETSQHNQILGHTVFSWTGDADTAWASQSSPRQVKMHRRTVRMALVSRDTTIRLLFLTVQSAIKIAALSSGGVTAAAALPLAWNYIKQVLAELEALEASQQEAL